MNRQGEEESQKRRELKALAHLFSQASHALALTGAGISASSGIPTFRDPGGLWDRYPIEEYGTLQAFYANPKKVWELFRALGKTLARAKPTPSHRALAELERLGFIKGVITQNIDGLHQKAGSSRVLCFHGTGDFLACLQCKRTYDFQEVSLDSLPPVCVCGGILKPDIILFGEPIPQRVLLESFEEARKCDLALVIGTSGLVAPFSQLLWEVANHQGKVVIINPGETAFPRELITLYLPYPSDEVLPEVLDILIPQKANP